MASSTFRIIKYVTKSHLISAQQYVITHSVYVIALHMASPKVYVIGVLPPPKILLLLHYIIYIYTKRLSVMESLCFTG